jgi:hypothetical protein
MLRVSSCTGEYDYITLEDVYLYADSRPGSKVATVPKAHLAFVDNPMGTNESVYIDLWDDLPGMSC